MRTQAYHAWSKAEPSKSDANDKPNKRQHSSSDHFTRKKRTYLTAVGSYYKIFSNMMLLQSLRERTL